MDGKMTWTTRVVVALIAVCCLATELALVTANDLEGYPCRPPSIQRHRRYKSKRYFTEYSKIKIPCNASGDGHLRSTWLKDGAPVDLSSDKIRGRKIIQEGTGSLVIIKARKEDAGVYLCQVANRCGTSLSTTTDMVYATMKVFPEVAKPEIVRGKLREGLKLTCTPPFSQPQATIRWILSSYSSGNPVIFEDEDGEFMIPPPVELDRRVTMDYDGNLYITSLRKEDEQYGRTYVCSAQNNVARNIMNGEDKVIVTRRNRRNHVGVDLMWHSVENTVALRGKTAKFKCIFSGYPEPAITWTRVAGGEWDDYRMIVEYNELLIKEVKDADAGEYRCSGINSLYSQAVNQTFILSVEAAPEWRVKQTNVEVEEGETAVFRCDAVGNPRPSVQWFVDGSPFFSDDFTGVWSGKTLTFTNVDLKDSKNIQCLASNTHGQILMDVYLYVKGSCRQATCQDLNFLSPPPPPLV